MYCVSALSSKKNNSKHVVTLVTYTSALSTDEDGSSEWVTFKWFWYGEEIILSIFLYDDYSKHYHIGTLDVLYHMKAETIIQSICWHSKLDLWHAIIRGICGCIDKHLALSSMYRGVRYALNVRLNIKCKEFMSRNFRMIPKNVSNTWVWWKMYCKEILCKIHTKSIQLLINSSPPNAAYMRHWIG